jgi:peptidoglycan-N-acetylglucosamine deacetylase
MKIVQCWDDGITDDIRLIEILRKHGAKASFNLNMGTHQARRFSGWKFRGTKAVWKLSLDELIDVYAGFLVANHTLTHPHLTQIPPDQARREIVEGRDKLEQFFGYEIRGFVYPFDDRNPVIEEMVRDVGHLYARTANSASPCFPPANAMTFNPDCHFLDPDFWAKFEKAKSVGDVFYFWGHSYELITEDDWQKFDDQIARLAPEAEWTNLPDLFQSTAKA